MSLFIDRTGKKYGRITVIRLKSRNPVKWLCSCHCGKSVVVDSCSLGSGNTKSCGCLNRDTASAFCKKRFKDIAPGTRFGNLVVTRKSKKKLYDHGTYWVCRCDCGKEIIGWGTRLRAGRHTHCGCKTSEIVSVLRTVHGYSRHPAYRVCIGMIRRCYDPKTDSYPNYGGRGIKVCDEWREHPDKFVEWSLANGYRRGLSIDRFPYNDGDYTPENCRWATQKEQARNTRSNNLITWRGETKTIVEWSEITGIKYHTINKRITKYGWSVDEAMTLEPSRNKWRRVIKTA